MTETPIGERSHAQTTNGNVAGTLTSSLFRLTLPSKAYMAEEDDDAAADALSASDLHFVFACGLSASDLATCALVSKFWR